MTFFGMALLTAIGTVVLAAFAVVTAVYARKAFREQSREVAAIEQQVKDEQEVTRQQAELLKVQTGQLELQRQQLEDQRAASARQAEVLDLQAVELHESLDDRKREAARQRRAQATYVFITESKSPERHLGGSKPTTPLITAGVKNSSNEPIYGAELRWYLGSSGYGEPSPEPLGVLLPGADEKRSRKYPQGADLDQCGAVLRFSDAAGFSWLRYSNGFLEEGPPAW